MSRALLKLWICKPRCDGLHVKQPLFTSRQQARTWRSRWRARKTWQVKRVLLVELP